MKADKETVARWRLAKALATVLAIVCVVPGVDAVMRVMHLPEQAQASATGLDSSSLRAGGDPFQALGRIEDAASADERDAPGAFLEEIGFLPQSEDIRCNDDGNIIGYSVEGEEKHVLEQLVAHMEQRGWTSVPLGGVIGATFVKDGGRCTWALATCSQVGSSVAVVVRCVIA